MAVISLFGDSLGSKIIVPLLLNTFTAGTSWQAGYTALAVAVVLCGGVAVCLTKEREDPKDEAEAKHALAQLSPPPSQEQQEQRLSDYDEEPPDETETGPLVAPSAAAGTWTRAQVLHSPTFWVYALALASSYMLEMGWLYEVREVVTAMTTSSHAFADSSGSGDRGESTAGASTTAGVSLVIFIRGVCSCGGTALGGMLYDRHGARTCVVLAQLCQVVSMALMGWPRPSLGSRILGAESVFRPRKRLGSYFRLKWGVYKDTVPFPRELNTPF